MIGRTLGSYRIVEKIGMGGMATVYKAFDPNTERHVAIKILPEQYAHDAEFYERFRREAKAIAKLEHLHILPVHAYGEEDNIAYLVMRYMPTGTLSERIRQGAMPYSEISRLLRQIAGALDHAHEQNILHRDVKPSNVLLDEKGNAYLTDFGLARMMETGSDLTGSNMLGTPQYMSPEQCQGRRDLTPATDIYSLGVVLYEMVTGRTPFQAETPLAVIHMQLSEPLPAPRSLRSDVPESVENVIYKALAKQPESRYTTCLALAEAFDKAIAASSPAPRVAAAPAVHASDSYTFVGPRPVRLPDEQTTVLPKTVVQRPNRLPLALGAALGLLLIGALAFLASNALDTRRAPTPTTDVTLLASYAPPTSLLTAASPPPANTPGGESAQAASGRVIEIGDDVQAVTFSQDGRWLLSSQAHTLRVYDVPTGEVLITIPLDGDQSISDMEFSPDGRLLAAGGVYDVRLSLAATLTDAAASPINVLTAGLVRAVAFSPDSQYLIAGGDDGTLYVWRVNDGTDAEPMAALQGHRSGISAVAFSPDGMTLASAGGYEDGRVLVWDLASRTIRYTLETGVNLADSVAFSPDGTRLAAATSGYVLIWDTATGERLAEIESGSYGMIYSPDGRLIAVGLDGGVIALIDTATNTVLTQLTGHSQTARAFAFSPDGMTLVSGGQDGTLRWWDVSGVEEAGGG
ncbi:MAG: protein kinase [Chloroflexi bacterium]|nr:protein kinase [Chloroflexota bacterium]